MVEKCLEAFHVMLLDSGDGFEVLGNFGEAFFFGNLRVIKIDLETLVGFFVYGYLKICGCVLNRN